MGNEPNGEGREANSASVAGATPPQQAEDIRHRWWWVEHRVWTDPMLARLEQNEPGTKWFRLWDKVLAPHTLEAGFWAVWRNEGAPGVDGETVTQFAAGQAEQLHRLSQELHTGRYRPAPARRKWLP